MEISKIKILGLFLKPLFLNIYPFNALKTLRLLIVRIGLEI